MYFRVGEETTKENERSGGGSVKEYETSENS